MTDDEMDAMDDWIAAQDDLDGLDDLVAVMEEPAGGENFGRRTPLGSPKSHALNHHLQRGYAFITDDALDPSTGGIVSEGDRSWAGMKGYRSQRVLEPEEQEWVDREKVRRQALAFLGASWEEIRRIYAPGFLAQARLTERAKFDAQFLELKEQGGNMAELGGLLGFSVRRQVTGQVNCEVISRACKRAEAARDGDDVYTLKPRIVTPEQLACTREHTARVNEANAKLTKAERQKRSCLGLRIRKGLPCWCGQHTD